MGGKGISSQEAIAIVKVGDSGGSDVVRRHTISGLAVN